MQIIANFSYAGTSKYVSHAVENNRTLCGMNAKELLARSRQEWEYLEEDNHLGVVHKLSARDVGCVKCSRLLTKRATDAATCFCTKDKNGKVTGRFAGCVVHSPQRS